VRTKRAKNTRLSRGNLDATSGTAFYAEECASVNSSEKGGKTDKKQQRTARYVLRWGKSSTKRGEQLEARENAKRKSGTGQGGGQQCLRGSVRISSGRPDRFPSWLGAQGKNPREKLTKERDRNPLTRIPGNAVCVFQGNGRKGGGRQPCRGGRVLIKKGTIALL